MRGRVAGTAVAIAAALGVAASTGIAQSPAGRVDAHVAAAKAAAGTDFAGVFNRDLHRSGSAGDAAAAPRPRPRRGPPGPPPRETWHAEPVKVFDNLYFLGQTEYSVWAVTTSAGIILIDAIFDYSVDDEVVGGMKKLGLDPATIKYVDRQPRPRRSFRRREVPAGSLQRARAAVRRRLGSARSSPRGRRPRRDMVATDGQKLTLGDTTMTMYITPGHTLGTLSTLIPVKDHGTPHVAATWGGTAFNWMANRAAYITPGAARRFWFETYSASARRFREIAAKAGADVLISNHTDLRRIEDEDAGAPSAQAGRSESVRDRHRRACSAT